MATQVGDLGLAPGANLGENIAVFEATHGTAPKYADKDVINPSSLILSGTLMFDYLGWTEAAKVIGTPLKRTIRKKTVTYDLARQLDDATRIKCSEFGHAIVNNM